VFTASTGLAQGLMFLLLMRIGCGLAEAGAYPASGRLVRNWFPLAQRARASGVVAFGGRFGGAAAFYLTAVLIGAMGTWRSVLWLYGSVGIGLAGLSWWVFRDTPAEHPWANDAERGLANNKVEPARQAFPWGSLLSHRGLWMLNLASFASNVGWAFLVTWFPKYLDEVHHLGSVRANKYVTVLLAVGMMGMFFGGWLTDTASRRFGLRWGRRMPILLCASVASVTYLACLRMSGAVPVVAACCVVAFMTDSMVPPVWAFGQDVGGRFTAAAIAWSNAWGNLGAAFFARVLPWVQKTYDPGHTYHAAFYLCAGGFAVMALASLGLDSTKPLQSASPSDISQPLEPAA
jgi:ACS family glucarate transporter-like MFS transporter